MLFTCQNELPMWNGIDLMRWSHRKVEDTQRLTDNVKLFITNFKQK